VKVRLEVPNADQSLKPGMFADVILRSEMGPVLVAPDAALLDRPPADRFVSLGDGRFAPRSCSPAPGGGQTEILSGLDQGERVVAAANFMLDAESKLSEAVGGTGHEGHGKAEEK
jgi:hypothetical protein